MTVNGQQEPIVMLGNPNTPTVDIVHNLLYVLGADQAAEQEFLLQIDLSNPVFGASPTGGVDGKTFWNPATTAILLP